MPLMKAGSKAPIAADTDFPLNNLPYGVFSVGREATLRRRHRRPGPRWPGVEAAGLIALADDPVFDVPFWNDLMELGPDAWAACAIP